MRGFWLLAGLLLALTASAEARMHAPYRGHRIVSQAAPLDEFTQPAAAYSFRKLRTAYTGPAMRIIRDSDSAELDVGFTSSGDLNAAPTITHCAVTTCRLMTIYDQSGNSRHATQATPGNRPVFQSGCGVTGGVCSSSFWASIGLYSASYTWASGLTSMSAVGRRTSGAGACREKSEQP
jgi:hypothetical protein